MHLNDGGCGGRGDLNETNPHKFLLSLGVDQVPHATSSPKPLHLMTPETLLEEGSFMDHLTGNEAVVRGWQRAEPGRYTDAVALAALYHSIYGTAGFQGFTFPIEKRGQIRSVIGERAELLAYLTCAKDGKSFNEYVMLNRHLKPGETPRGSFTPRFNYEGYWPHAGYGALPADHPFTLTANEYTDMAAVQLSHVFGTSNKYAPVAAMAKQGAPGATEFRLLAEHLGGVAREEYYSAMAVLGEEPPPLPEDVTSDFDYEAAKAQVKAEAKL